jgi:ABC-type transporter Mla subunit MlaD
MTFNVANAVDDLRQLVAKADALAHASEDLFDQVIWVADDDDRRRLERLAHLVGATAEAVEAAVEAGADLATKLATHKPER